MSGGRGRHGGCALAAVATMAKLVVVQATGQLGLLEVSGNVLVGHFLKTSLQQIDLLFSKEG